MEYSRDWIIRRADLLIKECGVSPPSAFYAAAKVALSDSDYASVDDSYGAVKMALSKNLSWDDMDNIDDMADTDEGRGGCCLETKRKADIVYKVVSDIANHAGVSEHRVGEWLLGQTIPDYYEH